MESVCQRTKGIQQPTEDELRAERDQLISSLKGDEKLSLRV